MSHSGSDRSSLSTFVISADRRVCKRGYGTGAVWGQAEQDTREVARVATGSSRRDLQTRCAHQQLVRRRSGHAPAAARQVHFVRRTL